jgi:dGTPase
MHKTQVFIAPEGDHFRTRLTHTLEVAQVSRTIARALRLNEDLTEAIALGHDLGHTPFGHAGEDALNEILPGGFTHNTQSITIVEKLEKNGKGLNLTHEVLDGIREHRSNGFPKTAEGKIVQLSDKIAYINHDIDDAIRAGVLKNGDLPKECTDVLGYKSSSRINLLIRSVIKASVGTGNIKLEDDTALAMKRLREYLFETVYENQLQKKEREKIGRIISVLMEYYTQNPKALPPEFLKMYGMGEDLITVAANCIACMTDRFAIKKYEDIVMPRAWLGR